MWFLENLFVVVISLRNYPQLIWTACKLLSVCHTGRWNCSGATATRKLLPRKSEHDISSRDCSQFHYETASLYNRTSVIYPRWETDFVGVIISRSSRQSWQLSRWFQNQGCDFVLTENYEFMLLVSSMFHGCGDATCKHRRDKKKWWKNRADGDDLIELLVIKVMWYCYIWRRVSEGGVVGYSRDVIGYPDFVRSGAWLIPSRWLAKLCRTRNKTYMPTQVRLSVCCATECLYRY